MKTRVRRMLVFLLATIILVVNCSTHAMVTQAASKGSSKKPTKIVLNYSKKNLAVGESVKLKVKMVKPATASKKVVWTTSNAKVASVNSKGTVKAKKTGTVTIVAKSKVNKKVVAKCKIKVYKATKKLKLQSEKSYTMKVGETQKLKAKVTKPKKGACPVEWSSKDSNIAKVTSSGKVTAVAAGTTVITGKSGKKKVKVNITVQAQSSQNNNGNSDSGNGGSGNGGSGNGGSGSGGSGDDPAPAPTPDTPKETTAYNRGEWVALLADTMGYSMDESLVPTDEETGEKIYAFDDVFEDENALKIEAAVMHGIIPLETDEKGYRNSIFEPTGNVTREFAAVTAVNAMGYITQATFDCADSDKLKYGSADKMTVDRGVFALIDGAFKPDELVTEDEFATLLSWVEAVSQDEVIDEDHVDVIEYTDKVIESSEEVEDYEVFERDGELCVSISGNDIAEDVEPGDIFMLPANETFDLGFAFQIESASYEDGKTIYTGTVPDMMDVYEEIDIQALGSFSAENVELYNGFTFAEEEPKGGGISAEGASISGGLEADFAIDLTKEIYLDGAGNPVDDSDDAVATISFGGNVTFTGCEAALILKKKEVDLSMRAYHEGGVSASVTYAPDAIGEKCPVNAEIPFARLKLPLKAGFYVDAIASLYLTAEGTVSIDFGWDNGVNGVDINKEGFREIKEYNLNFTLTASVSLETGLNLKLELRWVGQDIIEKMFKWGWNTNGDADEGSKPIYNVGFKIGARGEVSITLDDDSLCCMDLAAYLFAEFYVGDGDTIITDVFAEILPEDVSVSLSKTWPIWDADNSPIKVGLHIENLEIVDECTRGQVGECKYTVEDEDGNDIFWANVSLKRLSPKKTYSARTNTIGVATKANLPADEYKVTVSKKGYKSYEGTVEITADECVEKTIVLVDENSDGESYEGESGEVTAEGLWNGLTWKIYDDERLFITGEYDENENDGKLHTVDGPMEYPEWTLTNYNELIKVVTIKNVSKVPSLSRWFMYDENLGEVNINNFDTSDVVDMSDMFHGCSSLVSLDLSGFDTSKVTNMSNMFNGCKSLTSLSISNFDTGNVTDMSNMFYFCNQLENIDVIGFDTSSVTNMKGMFRYCMEVTSLNVTGFETGNVQDMSEMFYACYNLMSLDISTFDMSKVTNMSAMFAGCESLTSLNLAGLDTSKVTNMSAMFADCESLTSLNLTGLDTSNVTNMSLMFGCESLTSIDISGFDTRKVTNMSAMFAGCESLTSLDLTGIDTSNVTDMSGMFMYCENLTSIDVSGFDTSNATDMSEMFSVCESLASIDFGEFDTSNVADMSGMFNGCSGFTSLDVSGFDTKNVTSIRGMFAGCESLSSIDISNFKTSKITDIGGFDGIFYGCSSLEEIDLSGIDMSNITQEQFEEYCDEQQFRGLTPPSVRKIKVPVNVSIGLELPVGMMTNYWKDDEERTYSEFPKNCSESFWIYYSE